MNIDTKLFKYLFNISAQNEVIGKTMVIITNSSSLIFQVLYIGIIIVSAIQKNPLLVPLVLGPATALFATKIIRLCFYRPRPFVALGIKSLIKHDSNSSFPSQHSASAFVIAISTWHIYSGLGLIMLLLAIITGLSRVMVGVHYPSDITAGALIGLIMGLLAFYIF